MTLVEKGAPPRPRVTVGMPVYNGERFVSQAIDAILAQSYRDFELLISDDGSSDGTERICRAAAARDARIRYERHAVNRGLGWNWNHVLERASGELLCWAAQDDLVAPSFIEKAVNVLDADPTVVLCYSQVSFIDDAGAPLARNDLELSRATDPRPEVRFRDLVLTDHWCLPIFGLIRLATLRTTRGYGRFVASDRVLLAELGLHGRFRQIQEPLLRYRRHAGQSIATLFHRRARMIAGTARRLGLPHFRYYREYFPAIARAPLAPDQRRRCHQTLLEWWSVNWNWARVLSDVVIAAFPRSAPAITRWWLRTAGVNSPLASEAGTVPGPKAKAPAPRDE